MSYQYKTTFKVIKNVFLMLKSIRLDWIITGIDPEVDYMKIITELSEKDLLNDFCQLVTDTKDDFEGALDIVELECVILGFFECLKGKLKSLKLAELIMPMILQELASFSMRSTSESAETG